MALSSLNEASKRDAGSPQQRANPYDSVGPTRLPGIWFLPSDTCLLLAYGEVSMMSDLSLLTEVTYRHPDAKAGCCQGRCALKPGVLPARKQPSMDSVQAGDS